MRDIDREMRLSASKSAGRGAGAGRRLDAEEFADAFVTHARALWCIAAGVLMNRDLVEDTLQEGAVIALGKLDQFEPGTSFIAWMGQIVRFVALNQGRRRRRSRVAVMDPVVLESVAADTAPAAPASVTARGGIDREQAAFDDEVLAGLRGLPETTRACVLLRTVVDLPYREIALALGIPEGTAMSNVHRGRRRLREHLQGSAAEERACTARPPNSPAGTDARTGS